MPFHPLGHTFIKSIVLQKKCVSGVVRPGDDVALVRNTSNGAQRELNYFKICNDVRSSRVSTLLKYHLIDC